MPSGFVSVQHPPPPTVNIIVLHRYIGIQEKEFEWLTEQLVSLANKCCQGRIVSALEGGYRIQGGVVSAFARSVASHVRALSAPTHAQWSWADVKAEQQREKQRKVMI
jgi:acetoin utilization deacetylase AcuC-like enzyme